MADQASNVFIDPSGGLVELPADQFQAAAEMGFVPASEKQVKDFKLQKEYGGAGSALATGAEGFAQALTLGLSTHVEKALGVDPEGIKAREELHPIAHGVGTVAGIAAPLVLSGGAAAPAEAGALGAARTAAEL